MKKYVYVQNKYGEPLMPCSPAKARKLLKAKKARVVRRTEFTIQLLYDCTNYTSDITLGVDAGSKTVGLSASTETNEYYASEVQLRTDIVENLSTRREYRSTRRNRKTRYRKPRFMNRKKSKKKGWLPPSIKEKINSHKQVVAHAYKLLPITKMIVEVAQFDIQKIMNPSIQGKEYQQGPQLGFWNVREYVLWRDNHTCQCCFGKSGDNALEVHHIDGRKTGGDSPDDLVTLCDTCHHGFHGGSIILPPNIRRKFQSFRDAAAMNMMRHALYDELKIIYPNVELTYGYITKNTRITNNLAKTHCIDALCIAGHPKAEPVGEIFFKKRVRSHNRQLHKATIMKGGKRKYNQAPKYVFGYRLFDKVLYNGIEFFVFGRRTRGYFSIRKLDGTIVHKDMNYKKLRRVEAAKTTLTERRTRSHSLYLKIRVPAA